MKSTFDNLSPKDKVLLVTFYETDTFNAFKRLLEAERLNIATQLVDVQADDVKTIARLQGRAEACKQLYLAIKDLYKKDKQKG